MLRRSTVRLCSSPSCWFEGGSSRATLARLGRVRHSWSCSVCCEQLQQLDSIPMERWALGEGVRCHFSHVMKPLISGQLWCGWVSGVCQKKLPFVSAVKRGELKLSVRPSAWRLGCVCQAGSSNMELSAWCSGRLELCCPGQFHWQHLASTAAVAHCSSASSVLKSGASSTICIRTIQGSLGHASLRPNQLG